MPLDQGGGRLSFVVPALLPDASEHRPGGAAGTSPIAVSLACYTGAALLRHNSVSRDVLRSRCTMPTGLFEQVG